ncbi:hypothetical protein TNCV_4954561 [Trichonephila clavipes]|nr:hypothetical protein TNCV_4954561 [Trichonephila clavipes]
MRYRQGIIKMALGSILLEITMRLPSRALRQRSISDENRVQSRSESAWALTATRERLDLFEFISVSFMRDISGTL